jgi:hypothetical protein
MGVVPQPLSRDAGVFGFVIQQEHQAGDACSGGGVELQFGVGNLRAISHRRAITAAEDAHVDVACLYPFFADLRGLLVLGSEIDHVDDRVSRLRHRPFHRSDVGAALGKIAKFGGVGEKHPPRISLFHAHGWFRRFRVASGAG